MFKAYIITTKFDFPNNKQVKELTERCVKSCKAHFLRPQEFKAITPYSLETVYPGWEIEIEYAKRLKINYEKKSGNPINEEMMNRMLVMQQSMTMSHYMVRKKIIEDDDIAVILEHDAIVTRELPLYNWNSKVVNLCTSPQQTHGYVTNAKNAKLYNDLYEKLGFVGHDNMNRHMHNRIKITPFSNNPIVMGNHKSESQWDTHRGALKEKNLTYMPTSTTGDVKRLLEKI